MCWINPVHIYEYDQRVIFGSKHLRYFNLKFRSLGVNCLSDYIDILLDIPVVTNDIYKYAKYYEDDYYSDDDEDEINKWSHEYLPSPLIKAAKSN
jgi:hypothetical protein